MDLLTSFLFICAFVSQQALGQDGVEYRAIPDKVNGEVSSGQPRTIYSQRHLSPHRMMHFGKRPVIQAPPSIFTPQVYDLYAPTTSNQQPMYFQPEHYPYLLSIELERGQTLQAVPEDTTSFGDYSQFSRSEPTYNVFRPQQQFEFGSQQQQLLRQLAGQKSSRLISNEQSNSGNNDNNEQAAHTASNSLDDPQQQVISVNTRSMQSSRANTLNLPKAFVSSLLYGRQNSVMPSFGGYNKKAEPSQKDNFFMHFGRK